MPTKKTRTKNRQLTYVSVCTQTENNFNYEIMIFDYQKQLDVLTKKISDYEATVIKLKEENNTLRQQNSNTDGTISGLAKNNLLEKVSIKEKSISPEIGNKTIKGCSCKGTCANKICGCVKKDITCNKKLCKCNVVQCKNQEVQKENELLQDGQKALEKIGGLTLNQEFFHASEKKRNIINVEKYSVSPLGIRRRLFTQDSNDNLVPESNSNFENREYSRKTEIEISHALVTKCNRKLKDQNQQSEIMMTDQIQNEIELSSITIDNVDDIFLPKITKVIHSPKDKKELKSVPFNNHVIQRKYRNNIDFDGIPSALFNEEIDQKKNEEKPVSLAKVQHSTKDNYQFLESDISTLLVPNTIKNNMNVLDGSLNPMIPTRQIPRSPISAAGNIILLSECKQFSPPKKELAVREVNWEQHKSELIMCKICKRKFFPHRIDKHMVSCKGI